MRIVVPAGGIGGARFLRGLTSALGIETGQGGGAADVTGGDDRGAAQSGAPGGADGAGRGGAAAPDGAAGAPGADEITVIGNTGDDITLFGMRVCPDLDTVMYTLGGGIDAERGWGRAAESFTVKEELLAYGMQPDWFGLGDRDTATHIVRSQMLAAGFPLSAVTAALCDRWQPGVRLLPMTDDQVETHIVVADPETGRRRAIHFQEWWIRHGAALPAESIVSVGAEESRPGPGVLEAVAEADVVLLPPSNPVVSVGSILGVPGIREALEKAVVVGVSPIIGGAPVRGMADACLTAIGVETSAAAVAAHYGPQLLDGWLVDESDTAAVGDAPGLDGIEVESRPLYMSGPAETEAIARHALDLAQRIAARRGEGA